MDQSPSQDQMEAIEKALVDGRKIEAIKIYREATGLGLKEAKTFIDSLSQRLIDEDPEKYSKLTPASGGCASVILLCIGLISLPTIWIFNSLS